MARTIEIQAWRDPDGVLRRAVKPRGPCSYGWEGLASIAYTDKRDAIRIYTKNNLHPILIHGIEADGSCTCGRPDCVDSRGKHPVNKGWQTAPLTVQELDAALIRNWRFNLGLRMGLQPNGVTLVCIDVDGPRDLLAPLEAKNGPLPPTLTASTGKGLHLIYKMPAGLATPKNRVRLAPGVDVRSEGGQIVCAPSVHHSGRVYRWSNVREPAELPT